MNAAKVTGYAKKSKKELIKAIDDCISLSQLFALIQHENIEIGVLKYVRLLSKNYYGKGLTTLNSIGRIYCPIINENGAKEVLIFTLAKD